LLHVVAGWRETLPITEPSGRSDAVHGAVADCGSARKTSGERQTTGLARKYDVPTGCEVTFRKRSGSTEQHTKTLQSPTSGSAVGMSPSRVLPRSLQRPHSCKHGS